MKKLLLFLLLCFGIFLNVAAKEIEKVELVVPSVAGGEENLNKTGDVIITKEISSTENKDEFLITIKSKLKNFGYDDSHIPIYMIVLTDHSGSINEEEHTKIIEGLKELAQTMFQENSNTYIAVYQFTTTSTLKVDFTNDINAINELTPSKGSGQTSIKPAFTTAKNKFDSTEIPENAFKCIVLLSDGQSTDGFEKTAQTYYEENDIYTITVGYGMTTDSKTDMESAASPVSKEEGETEKYFYEGTIENIGETLTLAAKDLLKREILTKATITDTIADNFVFVESKTAGVVNEGNKITYQIDSFDEENEYSFSFLIKLNELKDGTFETNIYNNNSSKIDIYDKEFNTLLKTVNLTSSPKLTVTLKKEEVIKIPDTGINNSLLLVAGTVILGIGVYIIYKTKKEMI